MPIIFVHGVAVREPNSFSKVKTYLQHYIAPEIAPDPQNVEIFIPFWGEVGAYFAWDGISRPRSALLAQGSNTTSLLEEAVASAELSNALDGLPISYEPSENTGGLAPAGPSVTTFANTAQFRLKDLSFRQLSDLVVTVILNQSSNDPQQQAFIALSADDVAHTPDTFLNLARCPDSEAEIELLKQLIIERYNHYSGLAGMGLPAWVGDFGEHLGEALSRAGHFPGFIVSHVLTEVRKPLNDFVILSPVN